MKEEAKAEAKAEAVAKEKVDLVAAAKVAKKEAAAKKEAELQARAAEKAAAAKQLVDCALHPHRPSPPLRSVAWKFAMPPAIASGRPLQLPGEGSQGRGLEAGGVQARRKAQGYNRTPHRARTW